jgi:hypothetical protein
MMTLAGLAKVSLQNQGAIMALYKYPNYLAQSTDGAFDTVHNPGVSTPHSGIYRCEGCGHEIASNGGNPFPPQNHHQHGTNQGSIRWRLVVYAQTK